MERPHNRDSTVSRGGGAQTRRGVPCRARAQVKAWCYYESRLLGAHHGLLSTYALETMVLYIFNIYHQQLQSPLKARSPLVHVMGRTVNSHVYHVMPATLQAEA